MKTKISPRLLRTRDAAAYLAASPWKIRELVQSGKLSFIQDREGSNWRFDVRELDKYIETEKQTL